MMIGGDHSTTIAGVRAYSQMVSKPGLIQIDSHFDASQDYFGEKINHSCQIARAVDAGFPPREHAYHRINWMGAFPDRVAVHLRTWNNNLFS